MFVNVMYGTSLTTSLLADFVFARLAGHIKVVFIPTFISSHPSANPWLCFPKSRAPRPMAVSASGFSFKIRTHPAHVSRLRRPAMHVCRNPKNLQLAKYLLVRDPKTLGTPMYERCARPFKNTIKSFYVSGFPYKTATTARFHFSSLLLLVRKD